MPAMTDRIKSLLSRIIGRKEPTEVEKFESLNLPTFRSNQGLNSNQEYLDSGVEQINFLKSENMLNDETRILDFGCGQGRLVNALEFSGSAFKSYVGIDTNERSVSWCNKYLVYSDKYRFIHLPAYNEMYNKEARGLRKLPFEESEFDLIFLNSVFSHMLPNDIEFYLNEFHKVLKSDGFVYITAFVESNVPEVEENPDNYISKTTGALHRVRYEKMYLINLIEKNKFILEKFYHQYIVRTKQSVLILKKSDLN